MTKEKPAHYSRIAIVTGATSGIGEATARKFVASGYGVVGNARNAEKLRTLEQELGPAFCGVAGDAADNAVLDRLFAMAIEHFGKEADIVVANAGRGLGGSVKDADLSKFEEILKLNVTGTFALLQKAARKMLEGLDYPKRAADIVILGSVTKTISCGPSTKDSDHCSTERMSRTRFTTSCLNRHMFTSVTS